jgi:hypothetical protein
VGFSRINVPQSFVDDVANSHAVAGELGKVAQSVLPRARAKAPGWLHAQWLTRAGVGPKGAFGQAIARGNLAVMAEYGGRRSPAYAMFRSSI